MHVISCRRLSSTIKAPINNPNNTLFFKFKIDKSNKDSLLDIKDMRDSARASLSLARASMRADRYTGMHSTFAVAVISTRPEKQLSTRESCYNADRCTR